MLKQKEVFHTTTITTRQGDMFDMLAYRAYGDESGVNALIEANPAYIDTVVFPSGVTLQVPDWQKPSSSVLPPWRR